MKVKAKYPIKIGKVLVVKDSIGETIGLEEVRLVFPNITENKASTQIAVRFPGLDRCLVHRKQLVWI